MSKLEKMAVSPLGMEMNVALASWLFQKAEGFGGEAVSSARNGNGDISIEKTLIPQKIGSPVTGHFCEIWAAGAQVGAT